MELSKVSTDKLRQELDRRDKLRTKPLPLDNPNMQDFIIICDDLTLDYLDGKLEDSDLHHYIWESAMTCIYGKDFFRWYNNIKFLR